MHAGKSIKAASAIDGDIYFLKEGARKLRNFAKLEPLGHIYTNRLFVQPREFQRASPASSESLRTAKTSAPSTRTASSPPSNPDNWKYGEKDQLTVPADPNASRRHLGDPKKK